MTFSGRTRTTIGAAAVTAALILPSADTAHAAQVETTDSDVVPTQSDFHKTQSGYELGILPGQSVVLEHRKASDPDFSIENGDASTLPAGWSVLTSAKGLRITAAPTAQPDEFAVVEVTNPGEADSPAELRLIVDDPQKTGPDPEPTQASASSSWLGDVLGKFATLFSS